MYTLNGFLDACKLPEIQLLKGSGREFATTPIGKVFVADKCDWSKDVFVIEAGLDLKSKSGKSLAGTYWFCNAKAQVSRTVKRQ